MRLLLFYLLCTAFYANGEKECATRYILDQSVLCVCNSTYCDEIVRKVPSADSYVAYTSSKSGLRFKKTTGEWRTCDKTCSNSMELDPSVRYQRIEGFGGAVSDAAGINWKSLPPYLQDSLIRSYFSNRGLEYNMIRVPIGGTDFSTHAYAYNELSVNDTKLTNFTLAEEDYNYKIPMIKAAISTATSDIHIVATTWSPPLWMKTGDQYGGFSRLKKEYYQTYADYHLKFLEQYKKNGIPIWGITTTNEPINGVLSLAPFNSLGWSIKEMGKWIVDNLGPTIRNSPFRSIKIITGDDQRVTVPFWFNVMLYESPKALEYIDGIAVHYYTDQFVSPVVLEAVTKTHPDKFIIATEACEGAFPWETPKVLLGSWSRAVHYITDIMEDLKYNVVGWIDWNLCLDLNGGPNWAKNFVDSLIIVNATGEEYYKQPMYYAMGHFSKFIPRGSQRIELAVSSEFKHLDCIAFLTPRNTIVVIIYNSHETTDITINCNDKHANITIAGESVTTVELPYAQE